MTAEEIFSMFFGQGFSHDAHRRQHFTFTQPSPNEEQRSEVNSFIYRAIRKFVLDGKTVLFLILYSHLNKQGVLYKSMQTSYT